MKIKKMKLMLCGLIGLVNLAFADTFNYDIGMASGTNGIPYYKNNACAKLAAKYHYSLLEMESAPAADKKNITNACTPKTQNSVNYYVLGHLTLDLLRSDLVSARTSSSSRFKTPEELSEALTNNSSKARYFLSRSNEAFAYVDMGDFYSSVAFSIDQGNPSSARDYYLKALDKVDIPYAHIRLAEMAQKCFGFDCYPEKEDSGLKLSAWKSIYTGFSDLFTSKRNTFCNDAKPSECFLNQIPSAMWLRYTEKDQSYPTREFANGTMMMLSDYMVMHYRKAATNNNMLFKKDIIEANKSLVQYYDENDVDSDSVDYS